MFLTFSSTLRSADQKSLLACRWIVENRNASIQFHSLKWLYIHLARFQLIEEIYWKPHMAAKDVAHCGSWLVEHIFNWCAGGFALCVCWHGFLRWNASTKVPGRLSAFSHGPVWQWQDAGKEDEGKTSNFNLDNKPLFVVEAQNGFILNSGASKSDVSINFNLLSLLLIFTIVHWLSVVTVFSLETLTKAASGAIDEGHLRCFTSSRL